MKDIIQKIKKLLNLAENNKNIEEAARAASKAQSLMEKHRIEQSMLETAPEIGENDLQDSGSPYTWKAILAAKLAKHNGCYALTSQNYFKDNLIRIVGEPEDRATIQFMYTYLVKQLLGIYLKNTEVSEKFFIGGITYIEEQLMLAKEKTRKEYQKEKNLPCVLAVLDTKDQVAKNWAENIYSTNNKNLSIDTTHEDFKKGYDAAKRIKINPKEKEL